MTSRYQAHPYHYRHRASPPPGPHRRPVGQFLCVLYSIIHEMEMWARKRCRAATGSTAWANVARVRGIQQGERESIGVRGGRKAAKDCVARRSERGDSGARIISVWAAMCKHSPRELRLCASSLARTWRKRSKN